VFVWPRGAEEFSGGNLGMAEHVLAVESDGSVYERRRPTREWEDFTPRKHSVCGASTRQQIWTIH
jgi:hypothetical protein